MGDIAEGLLDGEFDCITGEYIGEGVGYPRTLHGNNVGKKKNKKPTSNLLPDNKIVWEYMMQQDKSLIDFNLSSTRMSDYTKEYGRHNNIESVKTSDICKSIRETKEGWLEFKKWFKTKI